MQAIPLRRVKSAAVLYVWDFGDGTFGTGLTVSQHFYNPGSYRATLIVYTSDDRRNVCDCKEKISKGITVTDCTAGKNIAGRKTLKRQGSKSTSSSLVNNPLTLTATPNPFNKSLAVTIKAPVETGVLKRYSLTLLTASGGIVGSKSVLANSSLNWDTTNLPAGVYLLSLKSADGISRSVQVVKLNQ